MKKVLMLIMIVFYTGCSKLNPLMPIKEKSLLSCEEKAKPKSLQFLEQQYRCTSD